MRKTTYFIRRIAGGLGLVFATAALADEMSFFGEGIDYWKDNVKVVHPEPEAAAAQEETPKAKVEGAKQTDNAEAVATPKIAGAEKFDWRPFLDAKNKEFFQEGDYTPPEPFMEIVRNPSDANLHMWFAYIERKNVLAQRLAERMEEYVRKNGSSMSPAAKSRVEMVASELPRTDPHDYRRLRFRMYFDSTCPHCQKMFRTLNDLQSRGFFVEARQIDQGSTRHLGSEVPIVPASKDELRKFGVNSVPLMLIGDLRTGKVLRHSGFQSASELLEQVDAIATAPKP